MAIILDGTTGITAPDITSAAGLDAADLTGTVASARLPAGSVIQVVNGSAGGQVAFSGTSGAVTGVSANITPISTSSKILVLVSLDGITIESDGAFGDFQLQRDGVNIQSFAYPIGWSSTDNARGTTASCIRLDSPSTTNNVTYSVYWRNIYQSVTIQVNRDGAGVSTITLMEIAA